MCDMLDIAYKISQISIPFIAILAYFISKKALNDAHDNTKLNIAQNELNIFYTLGQKITDCARLASESKFNKNDADSDKKNKILIAKEDLLNYLDNVCFYAKKGYITKINLKIQYGDAIKKIISDFENDFGEASTYNNIKDINREFKNN